MAHAARGTAWRAPSVWIPITATAALFGFPLAAVAATGLTPRALLAPALLEALRFGVLQAAMSATLAVALGFALARLHRRSIPGARWLASIHALTFVLPVFVVAYGLQGLLGPHSWLGAHGWPILAWLGPTGAIVLAHAYYNHGFAALILGDAMARSPDRLAAAAATLGAPPRSVSWRVQLPLLAPAAMSAFLLVFLFSFTAFGTVLLLGNGEVANLQLILYGTLQSLFPQPGVAAAAGLLEVAVNVALLAAALALRRTFERQADEPHAAVQPAARRHTMLAYAAAALVLLPVVNVLAQGFRINGAWSLAPWTSLLVDPPGQFDLGRALGNSLLWAALSSLVAVALVIAWVPRRRMEWLASVPMAVSPLLVAIGMLAVYGPAGLDVARPVLVVAGHTALALPFLARIVLPAAHRSATTLADAARTLGSPPRDVLWRVRLPILRGPLATGAALAAALSLGDLAVSSALSTTDTAGLAIWIHRLDGPFDPMRHARAVALTGLLCLMVVLLFSTTRRQETL